MEKILCVDFDTVIHSYKIPWQNEFTIPDPPVPGGLRYADYGAPPGISVS